MKITKQFAKRVLLVSIGLLILTFGMHMFLIPANLAAGGTSGLGMVAGYYFPNVPIGIIIGIFNIVLLIISFIFIGREFGGLTVYSSILLSGFLLLFEWLVPLEKPLVDDLFINLVFGILISGVGMGIVFNQNSSTGGTDIIAKILNVFFHIEIGKGLLMADAIVVLLAAITFGLETGLYALLGVILNSFVIDAMIAGFTRKISVQVISNELEQINNYLQQEIVRGGTIFSAIGAFTGHDKPVLYTVLNRNEFIRLRTHIRKVDPNAFVIVSYIHEVEGEGFTR